MLLNKRFLGVALAAPLALSACGGDGGTFDLNLLHMDCTDEVDFIPRSSMLTIRVTGDGMKAVEETVSASARSAEIPEVPFGSNRVVTVEAKANGKLVAYGKSQPFELTESEKAEVTVMVQAVNRFAGAADVSNACVEMTSQRAGHTAVAMGDGKVLLVGGFKKLEGSGLGSDFVATAEIYYASIGTFVPTKAPCDGSTCFDVGHGQGVRLKDGRILLAGGEALRGETVAPVKTAMIYEPGADKWTALEMGTARRGHTVHAFKGGKVLVIGGVDAEGNILDSTEIFDPATNTFAPGPVMNGVNETLGAGRAYHAAAMINDSTVMVAGGVHVGGTLARKTVYFKEATTGGFTYVPGANADVFAVNPVLQAGAGIVKGGMVLVGGATEYDPVGKRIQGATNAAQWMSASKRTTPDDDVIETKATRSAPCVASIDDNRILAIGGLSGQGVALDAAEVIAWNDEKKMIERSPVGDSELNSRMSANRAFGSCTNLGDGRILVTGGVASGANATSTAEIYTIRKL